MRTLLRSVQFALIASLAGCGGSDDAARADSAAGASAAAAPSSDAAGQAGDASTPFAFTEADLDALDRGLARETELVKASQERSANAKTPAERGEATQAGFEDNTIPEGAKAAGLDVERYRRVRETVNEVLTNMSFRGDIKDGPMRLDTALASAESKAKLAVDPLTTLSPESAAALRARMDRIVATWSAYKRLTAVGG